MNLVFAAASELQRFMEERGWRFCFIGGVALQRWGEPRVTRDVDVTLLTGFGGEEPFVDALLERYAARTDNARAFALSRRVVLAKTASGVGVDVALAGLPYEEGVIERSSIEDFGGGVRLRTCSAEDLVILKCFASRPQDWVDVEGVLVRQTGRLNWMLVLSELTALCALKESPEIVEQLQRVRRKVESR